MADYDDADDFFYDNDDDPPNGGEIIGMTYRQDANGHDDGWQAPIFCQYIGEVASQPWVGGFVMIEGTACWFTFSNLRREWEAVNLDDQNPYTGPYRRQFSDGRSEHNSSAITIDVDLCDFEDTYAQTQKE